MTGAIGSFLTKRIEDGDIPGAAYAIATRDGIIEEGAAGHAMVAPRRVEASTDTIYDLASLTKPLVTSLLYLVLHDELGLKDGERIWRVLPEIDRIDKRDITIRHLLTHTSGMPAWVPFYLEGRTIREYLMQIRDLPPESAPGTNVVYSDAGYIMLGEILQRTASTPLDRLADEALWRPLGLRHTAFNPPGSWGSSRI